MKDKRQFTRVNFTAEIEIIFDNISLQCKLIDISLKGVLVQFTKKVFFSLDDECEINISLNDSDIVMSFYARVAHIHEDFVGYKFQSTDIDSLTHLRNLLSYNTGNAEIITNELSFLAND